MINLLRPKLVGKSVTIEHAKFVMRNGRTELVLNTKSVKDGTWGAGRVTLLGWTRGAND